MKTWMRSGIAVATAAALVSLPAATLATAEGSDPVEVVFRKAVLTSTSTTGEVLTSRMYTQIQATGDGTVQATDPVGEGTIRDLNGFNSPTVTDGVATWDFPVNGEVNLRTLQDFDPAQLPISIATKVTVDGQPVDPTTATNLNGVVNVTYTLTNLTGESTPVTWNGPTGQPVSIEKDIPLPYVGSATMTLPLGFSQVSSPTASIAGNGRGETVLNYTLVLFEPLGASTVEVSYEALAENATIPSAVFQFLPTAPQDNPTLRSAQEQYLGGNETGAKLTDGATQIDSNLLKISDGAGQLENGLQQLYDGSGQLTAALSDRAAPGARQLADGLSDSAVPGSKQIAAGMKDLEKYLNKSADPQTDDLVESMLAITTAVEALQKTVGDNPAYAGLVSDLQALNSDVADATGTSLVLSAGVGKAADGAKLLKDGTAKLAKGLVTAADGADELATGLSTAASGSGQITDGLGQAEPGSTKIKDGAKKLSDEGTKKLIAAGEETTNSFGERYGIMMALNQRAATGAGLPNGPAEGANVSTSGVFQFQVAGAAASASRSTELYIAAVVAIVIAAVVGTLVARRRRG